LNAPLGGAAPIGVGGTFDISTASLSAPDISAI
jgi:hypothetical protein